MEDAVALFSQNAWSKGLALICHVDPRLQNEVLCDPTRVRQVLLNLIGNAIKFTQQGMVFVTAQVIPSEVHPAATDLAADMSPDVPLEKADVTSEYDVMSFDVDMSTGDASGLRIRLGVQDTGIGISKEAIDHIFSAFSQAESSTSRRFGGTGLGLSISQRLAQLMGDLYVDSVLNEGSHFYFDIFADPASIETWDAEASLSNKAETRIQLLASGHAPALVNAVAAVLGDFADIDITDQTLGQALEVRTRVPGTQGPPSSRAPLLAVISSNCHGDKTEFLAWHRNNPQGARLLLLGTSLEARDSSTPANTNNDTSAIDTGEFGGFDEAEDAYTQAAAGTRAQRKFAGCTFRPCPCGEVF